MTLQPHSPLVRACNILLNTMAEPKFREEVLNVVLAELLEQRGLLSLPETVQLPSLPLDSGKPTFKTGEVQRNLLPRIDHENRTDAESDWVVCSSTTNARRYEYVSNYLTKRPAFRLIEVRYDPPSDSATAHLVGQMSKLYDKQPYHPSRWERILTAAVATALVLVVAFLLIRNQPIADPNLVVLIRLLVSLAVSVLGAVAPGFLRVNLKRSGLIVRAGGAAAIFVIAYTFTPRVLPSMEKKVDTLNNTLSENFELQSLAGDLVNDILFGLHRNPAQSSDLAGFRIMTPRLGSFFLFTKDNALQIVDSSGHVVKALPGMGADPNDEMAIFSVDLASMRKDFPEHLMGHLTPGDLGKSSLDFLMRPSLLKQRGAHFAIAFELYVSNATIFGGSYDFKVDPSKEYESGFSVYEDFFPVSLYPEHVKLKIERRDSTHNVQVIPNQGQDIEQSWVVGLWSNIDPVIRSVPELAKACRWPNSPEDLQRVPLTIHVAIAVGEPVVRKGGKIGQVKPLLYRDAFDSATMVTVMRGPPKLADQLWNSKAVPPSPPQQLKEIAAYLLSDWKNADDHGRDTYTAAPLKRLVFLFPTGKSVWVWELEGEGLSSGWKPAWISTEGTNLSKQAEEELVQFTSIWKRYAVAP